LPGIDWIGASSATLMPLIEAVRRCAHVFAAERLRAGDTTARVFDVGRTHTDRLWTYMRDYRPFGRASSSSAGADPPAAATS
jgi:transposase